MQWWQAVCDLLSEVARQQSGPQLLAIPFVLLLTVHCGYSSLKFRGYNPLHALFLALVALAVFLSPLALFALADNLDPDWIAQWPADPRLEQLHAAGQLVYRVLAFLAPLAGLGITYRLVCRTLRCTRKDAYHFMYSWTAGNVVMFVLLAISIPNYSMAQ